MRCGTVQLRSCKPSELTAAVKLSRIAEPYSVYVLTKCGLIAAWKISVDDEVPQGASDDDDGYVQQYEQLQVIGAPLQTQHPRSLASTRGQYVLPLSGRINIVTSLRASTLE